MQYLKIQNKGVLDVRLISLMGGSTKTGDVTKIGEYGTGLKYAITYFLREGIKFKLFIGGKEIVFRTKTTTVKGKTFDKVMIGSRVTDITLNYGVGWSAWEAIREIWCNAIDEKAGTRETVTVEDDRWDVKAGHTTFFIECTEEIQNVMADWDKHFISDGEPLFENDKVAIYDNKGDYLKLYKRGILIHTSEYRKSLFRYDLKDAPLNELREYRGSIERDVATAILNSNKEVVKLILSAFKKAKEGRNGRPFELYLDYSYASYKKEEVKELFSGYYFLTPNSSNEGLSERMVKVSDSFITVAKNCGIHTETITQRYTGSYGPSGYSTGQLSYKAIKEEKLLEKITKLIHKHAPNTDITVEIVVPIKEGTDFDFFREEYTVNYVVNSKLDLLNATDLEVIALLIVADRKQENGLYNIAKRLVKMSLKHKSLKSILFGTK